MITQKSFFGKILTAALIWTAPLTALFAATTPEKGAEAKDAYPLQQCVVSEEPLGSMGAPFQYMHKEAGKQDREVRFCCRGCVKDFKKNPEAYLKKIDEAAAAKKARPETPKA